MAYVTELVARLRMLKGDGPHVVTQEEFDAVIDWYKTLPYYYEDEETGEVWEGVGLLPTTNASLAERGYQNVYLCGVPLVLEEVPVT